MEFPKDVEDSSPNSPNLTKFRYDGYLYKIEQRQLVGPSKRKFWFILPIDQPILYWFKSADDYHCSGRICLTGAAFLFDPRETGRFEIHANSQVHILEAPTNQNRMEWLRLLQASRKHYYEKEENESNQEGTKSTDSKNETATDFPESSTFSISASSAASANSTFYLDPDGKLNLNSLEVPPPSRHSNNSIDIDLVEVPTKRIINKAKESIRAFSIYGSQPSKNQSNKCENCKELVELLEQLRNRCYELTDELIAHQELVSSLKRSVFTASKQRDTLVKLTEESTTMEDKLDIILERESTLAGLQFTVSELRREIEYLKEENRRLESENSALNTTMDAFRESVRTKDELIMKYYDQPEVKSKEKQPASNEEQLDGVPEAILVDTSASPNVATKQLFDEASVSDINEMKDLVVGYRVQNEFLNKEIMELQRIIQALEDRERKLIRQNFEVEAIYYQLKSRYIMVLNHFRSAVHPRRLLEPSLIQDLINEISRPTSPMRITNSTTASSSAAASLNTSALGTDITSAPKNILISPYYNMSVSRSDPETDALGFYLNSPRTREAQMAMNTEAGPSDSRANDAVNNLSSDPAEKGEQSEAPSTSLASPGHKTESPSSSDWLLRMAADNKKRADDIWANIALGQNKEYIDWLQRWDAFLVNHVLQPMPSPNPQLKMLVRHGIPHAYSVVDFHTANVQNETGKGYYECLLRKAEKVADTSVDNSLKQIDLDLSRTLPTNKKFDKDDAEMIQSLKNVLYAFRFHNKEVEYCQGLNRLAAIGLLYLSESDAFWFLVACVEYLQPTDYYTPCLLGAVADQKVLLDLMVEKLPALAAHLNKLSVDLSLFTLSWFLTIFVDVLSHNVYINLFDVFLYEGNKVLFRFALALLKVCEAKVLECTSLGGVHSCLSNMSTFARDYKSIANIQMKK
ncbi:rab-GTPase-TBC domain-containing protein [Ditylenchus destructor]|uniref:Rab-GTPase-TBC domain-containing protein n=1 Tax=Ditylenchus destructor TaxID=166010 RepID=A0AAD4MU43_9BILA|nr:rab-GTPase-TBC domain-containing protein [Ditylenchus destructor]